MLCTEKQNWPPKLAYLGRPLASRAKKKKPPCTRLARASHSTDLALVLTVRLSRLRRRVAAYRPHSSLIRISPPALKTRAGHSNPDWSAQNRPGGLPTLA